MDQSLSRAQQRAQRPIGSVPSVPSVPARSETDVEALLVWAIRDQKADRIIERGAGLHAIEAAADGWELQGESADGVLKVARNGELGTHVDGGGWSHGDVPADAETVYWAAVGLAGDHGPIVGLLLRHAREGSRPDWMPGAQPRMVAMRYATTGRPIVEYDKNRHPSYCRVYVVNGPGTIAEARALYRAWHYGLVLLAEALRQGDRLARHRVSGPKAPATPWENDP